MATDIKQLGGKVENDGATPQGTASAEEWNLLIQAVTENQGGVKKIIYNKKELPVSSDGVVEIEPISSDSRLSLSTSDSTSKIVSINGSVILHLRATSVLNGSDTYESVGLEIQRYSDTLGWLTVGNASISAVAESDENFAPVDVSPYLVSGNQQLRVKATGSETGLQAIVSFASVVFTKLELEFAGQWHLPFTGTMPLSYYINGAVAKTLHLTISGKTAAGVAATRNYAFALGEATYPTTPWATSIEDNESDTCKIMSVHGVHKVEAWLTCDDGNGGELESGHIYNQLMVVANHSDSTPYLMLQNVADTVTNYVQAKLLDFAVYSPAGAIEVAFAYTNYAGSTEYLRIQQMVASQTANSLINTIEIEGAAQTSLYAYLHIARILSDGSESDFMLSSIGQSTIAVSVDNSLNFSPTIGADFVLNPKTRNNTESNPARILNAAKNNQEITGSVFSGFGFVNDGWITDNNNNKVLRVLAGQSLSIPYECFQDFIASPANSLTIELDFAVRNITNEVDPIFRICSYSAATGKPLGIEMKPLEGVFLTTSKTTEGEQDFRWREGVRTHIAFNIVHALRSSASDTSTLSLVRVFINNVINREFMFDLSEAKEFINESSLGIRIGQEGKDGRSSAADIDIYSIRVYRKALGASDCKRDYEASLPTSAQKLAFRNANDILSPDGTISYSKASAKYNCIVWHGFHTSGHSDADKNTKKGWLEISQLDASGKYDPEHSGTICKATASLPDKGQGSTAKTYYEWNQQYDINKATGVITVDGEEVPDGWIDGNGVYRGQYFELMSGAPKAQKNVLKINYASSMQSHKQGGTELYNELYKMVVGATSIQQTAGFENTRVAVIERPFLYFTQSDTDSEPVFQGLGTFGPGKMDKKTWGFDKKVFPYFCMLEGSDNNMPLTDMRVPWTDETVAYNPGEEYFEYAGMGNLDFDAGATDTVIESGKEVEYPKTDTYLPKFKDAWNWLFMHNCQFVPFDGSLDDFMKFKGADTRMQYWMTQSCAGAAAYDLVRYNVNGYDEEGNEIGEWVPAGMPDGVGYAVKNLLSLFPDAIPDAHSGQWNLINEDFQAAMAASAKSEFGNYFNERSAQFHYAFVNHFLAGTDNNSKNTYYVLDPVRKIIELHQDDLDTIFATDNVGWQGKPYYIDREHDWDFDGSTFYEGKRNVLFDLIERMYKAELPQMLNSVLSSMAQLVTAEDMAKGIDASPAGCMQKYFFSIQEYFPAVAYNETARIRYEQAQLAVNKGLFTPSRGVLPITQSLGNQLESERQFIKRRLIYMSSYAAYGEFSQTGSNALSFQGYPTIDGGSCAMKFTVTPHQFLYPTGSRGQTLIDPHVRVAPGEQYVLNLGIVTGDTNVRVCGVNYMRSLGNLGDISVNPNYSFPLSGERLVEFIAEPSGDAQFRPSSMTVAAPLLERFSINGSNVGGSLNLSGCTRLASVDLRGTSIITIRLPESERMLSARLPSLLSSVNIDNMPNLSQLTVEGYEYLKSIFIGKNVGALDSLSVMVGCFEANAPLESLSIGSIEWSGITDGILKYILDIKDVGLKGSITTYESGVLPTVSFEMKLAIIRKFGNVDNEESPEYRGLRLFYAVRNLTTLSISGEGYTHDAPKDYQYLLNPTNAYQNSFQGVSWSMTEPSYGAVASIDAASGIMSVEKLSVLTDTVVVAATITLLDGTTMVVTKSVGLYDRAAQLGDYVFADGSYSDVDDGGKTVVGICCYIGDAANGDYAEDSQRRLMIGINDIVGSAVNKNGETVAFNEFQWGLYYGNGSSAAYDVPTGSTRYSLLDSPLYDMYDLASILNLTSSGASSSTANSDVMRDVNQADGFKKIESKYALGDGFAYQGTQTDAEMQGQLTARTLSGELAALAGSTYKEGDVVNSGYAKTLKIIAHRNKIMTDSGFGWVGSIPQASGNTSEMQDLMNGMAEIRLYALETMGDSNYNKWSQFFYPAASACYAYEPSVKAGEELSPRFKKHNWFLGTIGQMARIVWYLKFAGADENIFSKAINDGKFAPLIYGNYWSCTESYSGGAWYIHFGIGNCGYYGKCDGLRVRPFAAF